MKSTRPENVRALIGRLRECEHVPGETATMYDAPSTFCPGPGLPWVKVSGPVFNMCGKFFKCGTPACLTGHALDLAMPGGAHKHEKLKWHSPVDWLAEHLGVDYDTGDTLYYGRFCSMNIERMGRITPEMTIRALEKLL